MIGLENARYFLNQPETLKADRDRLFLRFVKKSIFMTMVCLLFNMGIRLFLPFDVQRVADCTWVKLPTTKFRILWTQNPQLKPLANVLPASREKTEVTAVTSSPAHELQAWDFFHPMIHSALNYTANVI